MDINTNTENGKITVALGGKFTFADAIDFKTVLQALDKPQITGSEFNVSKLETIDSSGLGHFVAAHDIAEKNGYTIAITGASGSVLKVLKVTKMDNLFAIS